MKTTNIGRCHLPFLSLVLAAWTGVLWPGAFSACAQLSINFDSAPFPTNAPNNFLAAGAMQTYTIANVFSISGGVVLGNPTFLPSFTTNNGATPPNLYGTADFADPSLSSNITLTLNPALDVQAVSGLLFNGQPIMEFYTLTAYDTNNNPLYSESLQLPSGTGTNAFASFSLISDTLSIAQVTITTTNSGVNGWDFFVDSIDLTGTAVPEPSTLAMTGIGLAFLVWRLRHIHGKTKREKRTKPDGPLVVLLILSGLAASSAFAAPTWVEQGPGPIVAGQTESIGYAGVTNPVSGGLNVIVPTPTDTNTAYAAAVNGGVWVTHDVLANPPAWTNLTDQKLPMQSIASLAIDPSNPNNLFAGTGNSSNYGRDGSPGVGVALSTDGGSNWTLGGTNNLVGRPVYCIAAAGGGIVLAATHNNTPPYKAPPPADAGGVFRSTDSGNTFVRLSGNGASGLPDAGVTSLVPDPTATNRFYAASPGNGVYRSDNSGSTWNPMNSNLTGVGDSTRILLSVNKNTGSVFAMILTNGFYVDGTGNTNRGSILYRVFQSTNLGASWNSMGAPTLQIFPGAQGLVNGCIAADPNNSNVVFIAGDRQDFGGPYGAGTPNVNGCANYSANVFRGDASQPAASVWSNVVGNGTVNSSAPHADSRSMVFVASSVGGSIVYCGDGGMSYLADPNNSFGGRKWFDENGNVRPTEAHSVAYDPLNQVVVAGAQDVGSAYQMAGQTWNEMVGQGDGSLVAVGCTNANAGTSVRFNSQYKLGTFRRTAFNNANTQVSQSTVQLMVGGNPLSSVDRNIQSDNPYVLNTINPQRMLLGTADIYESINQGDTLNDLVTVAQTGAFIGAPHFNHPMAYGSSSNGVPMPDVFYVGAGTSIWHRDVMGGAISQIPSPGGRVASVVVDPQNFQNVYMLDVSNRVFASFNEGANWTEVTLNLTNLCTDVRCIEIFNPTNTPINTVLIAAGMGGIYQMRRPAAGGTIWTNLSSGLPRALFMDVRYDYNRNVLAAGSLGRGTWTLTGYFRGGGSATNALPPVAQSPSDSGPVILSPSATDLSGPLLPPRAALDAQAVVLPPTTLSIQQSGGNMIISWPAAYSGCVLQASQNPSQLGSWTPVTAPIVQINGVNTVTVPVSSQQQFYRLSSN